MLGLLIFACAQTTPSSDLLTAAPASPVSASYVAPCLKAGVAFAEVVQKGEYRKPVKDNGSRAEA